MLTLSEAATVATDSYLNFDLELLGGSDAYVARVIRSPAGEATNRFVLPFSDAQLATWLVEAGIPLRHLRVLRPPTHDPPSMPGTLGVGYSRPFLPDR